MLDSFIKTYGDRAYRFPVMLSHAGVVLAFAMDASRRISYAVLDLAHGASAMDVDAWPANPTLLPFPNQLQPVGFAATDPTALPQIKLGTKVTAPPGMTLSPDETDTFLSSTARLTAAAPFQVVSDGRFIYLFRQAITDPTPTALAAAQRTLDDAGSSASARAAAAEVLIDHANTVYVTQPNASPVVDGQGAPTPLVAGRLLVDRFLLVGTELQPKLEVRYQRSRNKSRPASRTDGLGAKDLDGRPFVEPTQELRFLPAGDAGRFSAVLVPTSVADAYRWQIFTAEADAGVLWSHSVEQSADGLFNTAGSQPFTCTAHPDVFALVPGTCSRPVAGQPCGLPLVPAVEFSGAAGSALTFDRPGAVVRLAGVPVLGSNFTLEAWVRPPATASGDQVILGGGPDDAHSAPRLTLLANGGVGIAFGDGTTLRSFSTNPVLTAPGWHHLSVSLSDTLVTVSVDGQPVATSGTLAGHAPIAAAVSHIGAETSGFAGQVDEVRLWNRARSVTEVRADLHSRLSGLETGLASYWRLAERVGSTVCDQSGRATGSSATWDG
jgi:hypothetical protein